MKILWFEVTVPGKYEDTKSPIGGWQDSLEYLLRMQSDIDLGIAFEGKDGDVEKVIEGVRYFPIIPHFNYIEKIKNKYTWDISRSKLLEKAIDVINRFNPDIIHVFGSEWCWGQIAKYTKKPVVIHMQGSIPPYLNAEYPPGYNIYDRYLNLGLNFKRYLDVYFDDLKMKSWKTQEEDTLRNVSYYMGRTEWDKNIVKLHNPQAQYFHCDEALRPDFINSSQKWELHDRNKLSIITTGCGSFWKGIDTILRTAKLLKERNIDFEWKIVGEMPMKSIIEKKENLKFEEQNIKLLGYVKADALNYEIINSDVYVHTSYIDNSPNAICEAQYLGIPIIATYVGGVPSLINNLMDGILIPANAPYTLASKILELHNDKELQLKLSNNARKRAMIRHKPSNILKDLLKCYYSILSIHNKHCNECQI